MSLITEDNKYKLFLKKLEKEKEFNKEINNLYKISLKSSFKNILNIPKLDFLNKISKDVNTILIGHYSNKIIENESLEKILLSCSDKYEKKYDEYIEILSSQWKKYTYQKSHIRRINKDENKLDIYYFKNFTKHCAKTGEYALHRCDKKIKLSKFIIVNKKTKDDNMIVKYIICENCRKTFFVKTFKNYCEYCKIKYYSTCRDLKTSEIKDNKNLFLATVYPTHCNTLFNKVILCQKCNKQLYIDIKANELICLNQKCNYKNSNPDNIEWKCNKCNTNYETRVILYNKIEIIFFENLVKKALILKKLAQPTKTCCINDKNISSMQFYHNKKCQGILYLLKENKTLFIICEKCKAINFYQNFIWTCPRCGLYYREINIFENEISKNKKREIKKDHSISNRKRKNFYEYIEKKKNYKSIDMRDIKEEKLLKTDIKMKEKSKIYLKKNLSKNKNLINSNEKGNNYKPKNISTDFSTSFLETNDNNYRRGESQNKRSSLCRKILNGFIRPLDEKTYNSVDKRYVINNSESLPNYDFIKIDKNYKNDLNLSINLLQNFENCISTGRQYENDMEEYTNSQLNTINYNFIEENINSKKPFHYNINNEKNLYNNMEEQELKDNNNENDGEKPELKENNNENNIKEPELKENKNEEEINKSELKENNNDKKTELNEKTNDNNINDSKLKENNKENNDLYPKRKFKNKVLFKRIIKTKNNINSKENSKNDSLNNILTNKFKTNNNIQKENKENINYSISTKIDIITIKNSKREIRNNENQFVTRKNIKNIDSIYNINNNLSSSKNSKYSALIIEEKEKKNNINEEKDKNNKKNHKFFNRIVKGKDNKNEKTDIKENICKEKEKEIIESKGKNQIKEVSKKKDDNSDKNKNKEVTPDKELNKPKELKRNIHRLRILPTKEITNLNNISNIEGNKNEKDIKDKKEQYNKRKNNNGINKENKIKNKEENLIKQDNYIKRNNIQKEKYNNKNEEEKIQIILKEEGLLNTTLSTAIKIDDEKIKQNNKLFENIKMRLINLVLKSKLPLFDIDNFLIWEKIGNGSNGDIFTLTSNLTNKNYAVKIIKEEAITSLEYIIKEFEIIYQNKHKHIVNIYGICIRCVHKNLYTLYILMELALHDWDEEIDKRRKESRYYSEKELIVILKQLISVLFYLQKEKNISHRDIKLENILLFPNNIFKLCDFGEAKQKVERNVRKTLRGTDCYMSPLLYKGLVNKENYVQHNPYKSDVYSLGVSMIIAASLNFDIITEIRQLDKEEKIREIIVNNFNGRYSNDFIYCVMKMIAINEIDRPDFVDLSRIVQNYYYDI